LTNRVWESGYENVQKEILTDMVSQRTFFGGQILPVFTANP